MKKHSDTSERQSRRTFTKAAAAAIISAPLASSLVSAQQAGDSGKAARIQPQNSVATKTLATMPLPMHDTPPPLIIGDGSIIIESDEDFRSGVSVGSGKQQHRRLPRGDGNAKAYIHAIRVLLGNGETDAYFHPINDRDGCQIDIALEDGTSIQVKGGQYFYIQTESNKPLEKKGVSWTSISRNVFRYVTSNNSDGKMKSITITDGGHVYSRDLITVGSSRTELKIMIWVEDV